ncbi:low-affinity inorganic phosphate transporter [Cutibacterium acnes JCM 18918]|nr:low-affinity inorganic phosphate transporter [Cutibacterium acnes JCM 18918]
MVIAWLVTLPAAALVGAVTSAVAGAGTWGVIVDLGLLAVMAALIVRQANQHKVDHRNVNDSTQVGVRKAPP